MHLYYISDRKQFPGREAEQRRRLLDKIAEAAAAGVDYIQLREKDLTARVLEELAREAVRVVRENSSTTKLLINSRVDIALAYGADGVHLTSTDISAGDARAILASSKQNSPSIAESLLIGVSAHSAKEVGIAYSQGADYVVFGPVFEKVSAPASSGVGVDALRRVCGLFGHQTDATRRFAVFALGGITVANAHECVAAGASGIAGIRLFQANNIAAIVAALRSRNEVEQLTDRP